MKGRGWESSGFESFDIRAGRSTEAESFEMRAGRFMFLRGCSGEDIAEFIEDVRKEWIPNPAALSWFPYSDGKR
jgi:hypothetical protein